MRISARLGSRSIARLKSVIASGNFSAAGPGDAAIDQELDIVRHEAERRALHGERPFQLAGRQPGLPRLGECRDGQPSVRTVELLRQDLEAFGGLAMVAERVERKGRAMARRPAAAIAFPGLRRLVGGLGVFGRDDQTGVVAVFLPLRRPGAEHDSQSDQEGKREPGAERGPPRFRGPNVLG